jgi:hypothetical protein
MFQRDDLGDPMPMLDIVTAILDLDSQAAFGLLAGAGR